MKQEFKLVGNVLTTLTINELTPMPLILEFKAKIECFGETETSATYDEPACGGVEFQECTLTIGDNENDCYEIFEKLSELEREIENAVEYFEGDTGILCTESEFTVDWLECLVDLSSKQIFYIKDKDTKNPQIIDITEFVPSDVLQYNLEQSSIEV